MQQEATTLGQPLETPIVPCLVPIPAAIPRPSGRLQLLGQKASGLGCGQLCLEEGDAVHQVLQVAVCLQGGRAEGAVAVRLPALILVGEAVGWGGQGRGTRRGPLSARGVATGDGDGAGTTLQALDHLVGIEQLCLEVLDVLVQGSHICWGHSLPGSLTCLGHPWPARGPQLLTQAWLAEYIWLLALCRGDRAQCHFSMLSGQGTGIPRAPALLTGAGGLVPVSLGLTSPTRLIAQVLEVHLHLLAELLGVGFTCWAAPSAQGPPPGRIHHPCPTYSTVHSAGQARHRPPPFKPDL